jgi:hypothetical protein
LHDLDPDNWGTEASRVYKARVLRAFFRLLPDILKSEAKELYLLKSTDFQTYLKRINLDSLDFERIRAAQGNAGIRAIYNEIRVQVFSPEEE